MLGSSQPRSRLPLLSMKRSHRFDCDVIPYLSGCLLRGATMGAKIPSRACFLLWFVAIWDPQRSFHHTVSR